MSHALVVLPDDSAKPIVDAINGAKRALQIRMFLFTDPTMLQTVLAAKKRGVDVRVMLNPARRDGTSDNDATRKALLAAGIEVRDSNHDFALPHHANVGNVFREQHGYRLANCVRLATGAAQRICVEAHDRDALASQPVELRRNHLRPVNQPGDRRDGTAAGNCRQ